MVDANSRNQAFLDQIERNAMNGGEYFRIFHPDGSQVVDVEKTAIVDFIGRNPPETQAIGLIVKQLFQMRRSCADRPCCR